MPTTFYLPSQPDAASSETPSGLGTAGLPSNRAAKNTVGNWDLRFDPITGDFISDGYGGWQITVTAETAVMHQVMLHYNEWWGDPELGSRLHQLDLFATDPAGLIADETDRALNVLVDAARIADVDVSAAETASGRVAIRTSFRDTYSGQLVDQTILPSGAQ